MTDAAHQAVPVQGRSTGVAVLLTALGAGPGGWIAQVGLDYGMASYACYSRSTPWGMSPPPGWAFEKFLLLAVNLACLAIVVAALAVGVAAWRRAEAMLVDNRKAATDASVGRARFLAQCTILAASGFALATLFDTVFLAVIPTCWNMH